MLPVTSICCCFFFHKFHYNFSVLSKRTILLYNQQKHVHFVPRFIFRSKIVFLSFEKNLYFFIYLNFNAKHCERRKNADNLYILCIDLNLNVPRQVTFFVVGNKPRNFPSSTFFWHLHSLFNSWKYFFWHIVDNVEIEELVFDTHKMFWWHVWPWKTTITVTFSVVRRWNVLKVGKPDLTGPLFIRLT